MTDRPTVAAFRPDDERMERATSLLEAAGVEPVADPLLAVEPTGASPAGDADVVVFTSKTGAELAAEAGWEPEDASVAAVGERTAEALRSAGYPVDLVPAEYSSAGLVEALSEWIERGDADAIEVARSDHGSDVLLEGLSDAGASVRETVLYELRQPEESGRSAELAAAGELAGALFTSSLTVEHFLAAAAERGVEEAARAGLDDATVGAIGEPTAETARERGVSVDVVPAVADVEALVAAVVAAIDERAEE